MLVVVVVQTTFYFNNKMNEQTKTAKLQSQLAEKKILTTTHYKQFKQIAGNRVKSRLHAHNLLLSMADNYLFTVIVVNEKYEIIDGQHRFEAIEKLKLPLYYVVCEGYGLQEVHLLNQNSKTWNSEDYLEGYCNLGYPDYLQYRKFKDKYQLGHKECQTLLAGGTRRNYKSAFSTGEFKIIDYAAAVKQIETIFKVGKYYSGFRRRGFIYTMLKVMQVPNFDMNEFLQQLSINPTMLQDCARIDQYVELIENIYNYRKSRDILPLRYLYKNQKVAA